MTAQISGFNTSNVRISTQELLRQIYAALDQGETEFEILSSGHHDIGGPLWSEEGKPLRFKVKNPGQRIGAFGLAGTQIIVDGPAPADSGWLNAGAELIIKGDSGDTTAHCAAGGKIFVAGRVGTRSGSLMKHDPAFPAPFDSLHKSAGRGLRIGTQAIDRDLFKAVPSGQIAEGGVASDEKGPAPAAVQSLNIGGIKLLQP